MRFLDRMQDRILNFISEHSNAKREDLEKMVSNVGQLANDIGTVLDGKEAVEAELIDALGGLGQALDALYEMIEQNKKEQ